MTLVWRPGFQFDADASTYIEAVEAADTQALETGVRYAINDFVIGCKNDGIWSAIKACCILAGARTLDGCLVPLVGTAPARQGTEAGWNYDRETGLKGNGTGNYLDSGFLATSISATSNHLFVNGSSFPVSGNAFRTALGSYSSSTVRLNITLLDTANQRRYQDTNSFASINSGLAASGSVSGSRTSNSLSKLYQNGNSVASNTAAAALTMPSFNFFIYALNLSGSPVDVTDARFNFYSVGDGLTDAQMQAYHTRVSALITAIGAAIP